MQIFSLLESKVRVKNCFYKYAVRKRMQYDCTLGVQVKLEQVANFENKTELSIRSKLWVWHLKCCDNENCQ